MSISIGKLGVFLIEANAAGYASGEIAEKIAEKDGSKTIVYKSGDFKMHDNYFGGEPYGGREVVFYKEKPVWMMVYYGSVDEGVDLDTIYKFLQESLRRMPEIAPFRGPPEHTSESWIYKNSWKGEVKDFQGKEIILHKSKEVYRAGYIGGLVDQR